MTGCLGHVTGEEGQCHVIADQGHVIDDRGHVTGGPVIGDTIALEPGQVLEENPDHQYED